MEFDPRALTHETDAMAVIGQVLSKLPDDRARQRVLRWALERFAPSAAVTELDSSDAGQTTGSTDPALSIGSLDDMFSGAPSRDSLGAEGLRVVASAAKEPTAAKPPIERVVRSFAADFRRFAEEWKAASA